MNAIKKMFFSFYIFYYENIRIEKGKYFLGKTLYRIFGYAVYELEGIRMYLNPISLIDRKLITHEDHDPEVKNLIATEMPKGGIYVDIGANIGYFCLLAAKYKNVEVVAFEPSLRERQRMEDNVKLNRFTNIKILPYALSDKEQKLKLAIARDWNPGLNSFVVDLGSEAVEMAEVDCFAFEAVFAKELLPQVRVVKMDVEGYEMTVLKGMTSFLPEMKHVKFILEINPTFLKKAGSSIDEVYAFFEQSGFTGLKGKSSRTYDETFYVK
jgi:FkbM family methyltransferase